MYVMVLDEVELKNEWRTCLLGEKVFDITQGACILSGVVAACKMQNFVHQSILLYQCNSDSLLSQINNRAITLQTAAYSEYLQTIPAFVHIFIWGEVNSIIAGLPVLQRAIKHEIIHERNPTIANKILILVGSYKWLDGRGRNKIIPAVPRLSGAFGKHIATINFVLSVGSYVFWPLRIQLGDSHRKEFNEFLYFGIFTEVCWCTSISFKIGGKNSRLFTWRSIKARICMIILYSGGRLCFLWRNIWGLINNWSSIGPAFYETSTEKLGISSFMTLVQEIKQSQV